MMLFVSYHYTVKGQPNSWGIGNRVMEWNKSIRGYPGVQEIADYIYQQIKDFNPEEVVIINIQRLPI